MTAVDEVAQKRRQQKTATEKAEQAATRARRGTLIAILSAAVLAGLIGAAVASAVVGDARAARAATGRAELGDANDRLIALRAPVVPDPGPDASGDELVIAAAVARSRADLVAGVVRVPTPLPPPAPTEGGESSDTSSQRDDDSSSSSDATSAPTRAGGAAGGPSLVVVPGPPGQPARAVPAPAPAAPAAPAPAPAPAPRRGVLEPCLLGSILC